MVTDALVEANSTLKIAESITDPEEFLTLTDCVIPVIERSKEASLAGARRIIRRLRRRQLYRYVDEVLLPAGMSIVITPEQITTCQDASGTGVNLVPEDIHVAHVTLNFGMKDKNPVDKVLFFTDWDDQTPVHLPSSTVSYVLPEHFQEKIIRIFVKKEAPGDSGNQIRRAAKIAFQRFLRIHCICPSPPPSKRQRDFETPVVTDPNLDENLQTVGGTSSPLVAENYGSSRNKQVLKRTRSTTTSADSTGSS